MKKLVVILFVFFATFSANAQVDVKVFDKIGPDAILTLLGNPPESWDLESNPEGFVFGSCDFASNGLKEFGPSGLMIGIREDDYSLFMFSTDSPDYVFLTKVVNGGIKVGDSFNRIKSIDYVHSRYGRNKDGNGLKKIVSWNGIDQYCIFGEEYERLYLRFKNGILIDILYDQAQDCPYDNYDYTNGLL